MLRSNLHQVLQSGPEIPHFILDRLPVQNSASFLEHPICASPFSQTADLNWSPFQIHLGFFSSL